MVQRITLSLPDELHGRIQEYKEEMNLSKIFQDAVSKAIEKKEALKKRIMEVPAMDQIIERLKIEKQNAGNNYYEKGQQDALLWAKTASYEELQQAINYAMTKTHGAYSNPIGHQVLGEYFAEMINDDPNLDFEETRQGYIFPNLFLKAWEQGWKDAILEFWKEIKAKI